MRDIPHAYLQSYFPFLFDKKKIVGKGNPIGATSFPIHQKSQFREGIASAFFFYFPSKEVILLTLVYNAILLAFLGHTYS